MVDGGTVRRSGLLLSCKEISTSVAGFSCRLDERMIEQDGAKAGVTSGSNPVAGTRVPVLTETSATGFSSCVCADRCEEGGYFITAMTNRTSFAGFSIGSSCGSVRR